ncbi:MAG: PL29 family lyase N-terminal domain-containing protein, partial [Candidatus Cryptobacteroides sp.]|nr:PL29 family lyase N-terminal domain-containing protein [Candidatus Cryptobacteroides sp.]
MKTTINNFSRVLGVLLLCAGLAMTGCYDDSFLQQQLKDHESRLKELERLTAQQNTNISSLQTIVTALQDKDYVTSVAPINEGDEVVGYTITFSKSDAVTIYNGKDGNVPVIGVKQDKSDGQWYWTVDGEWLRDSDGDKVRASAEDGEDGAPGQSGVTPTLKIVDGYWYVSYDGGKTWEEETLGRATGDKGYTMFAEVTYDDEYLYITMADGEKLVLPRTSVGQEVEGPLTWSLDKVTKESATFSGSLTVQEADLPFSQVTVYYSDAETFNINDALKMSTTTFNSDQKFTIIVTGLKPNVKYNYCLIAEVKSEKIYSDVKDF